MHSNAAHTSSEIGETAVATNNPDAIFRLAVDTMEQGLLVHDGKTILASNARLSDLLECDPSLTEPGASVVTFTEFGRERGDFDNGQNMTVPAMWDHVHSHKPFRTTRQVPSGKTIRADSRAAGNCCIVTYSEVTKDQERKRLLETTLSTIAQGLLIHDHTRIVASNDRLAELLDVPRNLLATGQSWLDLVHFRALRGDYGANPEEHIEAAKIAFEHQRSFTSQHKVGNKYLQTECRFENGHMFVTYTDVTETHRQQERLRESEERVRHMAERDELTGLTNRRAFDEALERSLAVQDEDAPTSLALVMIDLDRFKPINDTYGHGVGDTVLCQIADRFRSVVREDDIVARIGGDEFAVLLEGLDEDVAIDLAGRLREAAAQPVLMEGDEQLVLRADASIGVAFASEGRRTAETLMVAADLALYSAKNSGRARVSLFDPGMAQKARARLSLETDLRHAVERKQLVLHYQVQRDLRSSQNVGYEALMRWRHPTRGLVQPSDFIPVAEETGLIVELGRWALLQATMDFAEFDDETRVSVNVSPIQFKQSDLVVDVGRALAESGLNPSRLEIEITEQLLIDDTEATLDSLNKLRDLGVILSLDDFGSGYSSLAYLTRFPFSKIKIDRVFIDRMLDDPRCDSLVNSILALAVSLGIKVTAEGVETDEQLLRLIDAHCDEAQGYLLGRPVPLEDITALDEAV